VRRAFEAGVCMNCGSATSEFTARPLTPEGVRELMQHHPGETFYTQEHFLRSCRTCGWWQLRAEAIGIPDGRRAHWAHQYSSILQEVDIASTNAALEDLRRHLIEKWDDRKFISASKAEDLVAGVLKDHLGCEVQKVTANVTAPDGGIDLLVFTKDGEISAAVQVKRRIQRCSESVQVVRQFIGALVVKGIPKGIFITTAPRFSRQAQIAGSSEALVRRDLELELIDGDRLLEMLRATCPPSSASLPDIVLPSTRWQDTSGRSASIEDILSLQ
jgi:restriction system protein